MKKLYILLSAMALATVATAQAPTLTPAYMYQANMGINQVNSVILFEPTGGANKIWDYSGLPDDQGIEYNVTVLPIAQLPAPYNTNTPQGTNFGTFNTIDGEDVAQYLKLNSTGAYLMGVRTENAEFDYGNGQLEGAFPLNYQGTSTQSMQFNQSGQPSIPGSTTIQYAGYGTLKLPAGTYTDVIYIKTTITFTLNGQSTSSVVHSFYKPGFTYLLKIIDTDLAYDVSFTTTPVGISENAAAVGLNVYPNPAADNLVFVTAKPTNYTLQVYNVNGALVSNNAVETNSGEAYPLDVTTLPQGIYTMVVTDANGNVATKRFIK